ncbi:MAG: flagellar biosynthesis protein FlhB [Phycisphaera sp.]|nr:flagellar biosynthesis protein FlhB [Phycisphaera sp.]
MAETDQEKTEQPTARRQQEARQEGNVARSQDLTAAVSLLAAVLLLNFFGQRLFMTLRTTVEVMLSSSYVNNPTRTDDLASITWFSTKMLAMGVLPVLLGISAVALVASVSQVGLIFTAKPLELNLAKLSPLSGLAHLFDARAGIRLVMSLAKVLVIAVVATVFVIQDLPRIVILAELDAASLLAASGELVYLLAIKLAALLLVLAIIDYAFQRWQRLRDLRMTKQEVKEEYKRMEGDPLIRQRRSRVARQLALQRIAQAVPRADVIVTNPTHFAVALRYESEKMSAPKVIAKGADFMALRIRQLAAVHEVPMVERKELARALYRTVEIGQEVPPEFYNAVAEILAYVYRLSGKRSA